MQFFSGNALILFLKTVLYYEVFYSQMHRACFKLHLGLWVSFLQIFFLPLTHFASILFDSIHFFLFKGAAVSWCSA